MDRSALEKMARRMRRHILDASLSCSTTAHLGGSLSMVEIAATLYGAVMTYDKANPAWEGRDRFVLSKGHGALALYSALLEVGLISNELFATFQANESDLMAHPVMSPALGIESSNGSLGQGLSLAVGLALAAKRKGMAHRVYVLLGDGECNEGAVWEAAMSAAHYELTSLVAIVDKNGFQGDGRSSGIMDGGDLTDKWASFGWSVRCVDGHDVVELYNALTEPGDQGKPKAILARTVKGKGVSFMENNNDWHHNRLTRLLYDRAVREIEAAGA